MWTNKTTILSNIILQIICYTKINKRNKKDIAENSNKVLAFKTFQAFKKTYITQKYIY